MAGVVPDVLDELPDVPLLPIVPVLPVVPLVLPPAAPIVLPEDDVSVLPVVPVLPVVVLPIVPPVAPPVAPAVLPDVPEVLLEVSVDEVDGVVVEVEGEDVVLGVVMSSFLPQAPSARAAVAARARTVERVMVLLFISNYSFLVSQ